MKYHSGNYGGGTVACVHGNSVYLRVNKHGWNITDHCSLPDVALEPVRTDGMGLLTPGEH